MPKPLDWYATKEEAQAERDAYAAELRRRGLSEAYGVGVEAFQGGWRVYVTRHDAPKTAQNATRTDVRTHDRESHQKRSKRP